MRLAKITSILFTLVALVFAPLIAASAHADTTTVVRAYHSAVTPISTTGSGVGTVRTFFIPIAVDGTAANGQYLTGTLTTLAENASGGLEIRGSNLTFVLGAEANQLVIGGISLYPPAGATLAPGQRTVRPVIGGSGAYLGARGQVVSVNLGPTGWTHTFRVILPG
jgi:hypothetical protein